MFTFTSNASSEADEKTVRDLIVQVSKKVLDKLPQAEFMKGDDLEVGVRCAVEKNSPLYQEYLQGQISKEEVQVKLLSTFLDNPLLVEGIFEVRANEQTVVLVKDGDIVCDPLDIVTDLTIAKYDALFRADTGKEVLGYVDKILQEWGERIPTGQLQFEGKDYIYTQTQADISVKRKKDGAVVLDGNGFTKQALEQDMSRLISIKNVAQELRNDRLFVPPIRFKI